MYKARKVSLVLSVIVLTLLLFEAANPNLLKPAFSEGNASHILRLHVVANSNREIDQRVKLLVRDAILAKFAPAASFDEAKYIVLKNGHDVQKTVDEVLEAEGVSYGASLRYGKMHFPEKEYGSVTYAEGEYEALKVELGEAYGENWWCVLFPPLCLVDIGVEDIPRL